MARPGLSVANPRRHGPAPRSLGGGFKLGLCCYHEQDYQAVADAGIRWIRTDRPTPARIAAARRHGIEVIPIAAYSYPGNREVEGSGTSQPPVSGIAAWADWAIDTWRSMAWAPKVHEIWNEPWNVVFFKPAPNAATYYQMVREYCTRAWAVWPDAIMLVCGDTGTGGNPTTWHAELLAADTDGFLRDPRIRPTAHIYCQDHPPDYSFGNANAQRWWAFDRYKATYADWLAHGHPNPQVWVTESHWETAEVGGIVEAVAVSRQLQAQYLIQGIEQLRTSGMVEAYFPFKLDTFGPVPELGFNFIAPNGERKESYYALRSYTHGKRR